MACDSCDLRESFPLGLRQDRKICGIETHPLQVGAQKDNLPCLEEENARRIVHNGLLYHCGLIERRPFVSSAKKSRHSSIIFRLLIVKYVGKGHSRRGEEVFQDQLWERVLVFEEDDERLEIALLNIADNGIEALLLQVDFYPEGVELRLDDLANGDGLGNLASQQFDSRRDTRMLRLVGIEGCLCCIEITGIFHLGLVTGAGQWDGSGGWDAGDRKGGGNDLVAIQGVGNGLAQVGVHLRKIEGEKVGIENWIGLDRDA